MPREQNFLLGNGEKLTQPYELKRSSRPKRPPYTFEEARNRLVGKLKEAVKWASSLPKDACAKDEVVLRLTLHPRYIAKTEYPTELFDVTHLKPIGRRTVTIKPDARGTKRQRAAAATDELFVSTPTSALRKFADELPAWTSSHVGAEDLTQFERLEPFRAAEKLRHIPDSASVVLEVVLHNSGLRDSLDLFSQYA